jgi:hypothetical protein
LTPAVAENVSTLFAKTASLIERRRDRIENLFAITRAADARCSNGLNRFCARYASVMDCCDFVNLFQQSDRCKHAIRVIEKTGNEDRSKT